MKNQQNLNSLITKLPKLHINFICDILSLMMKSIKHRPHNSAGLCQTVTDLCQLHCVRSSARVCLHVFCLCLCCMISGMWLTLCPCQQALAARLWAPYEKKKGWHSSGTLLKSGCMVDNKLALSHLPLQMLRLDFNCGTWVGKLHHYRQNSNAHVSGRVVNSSHNTSVYTVDKETATFAPLRCSHWIRIWHKFCTYKISKCHCSRR